MTVAVGSDVGIQIDAGGRAGGGNGAGQRRAATVLGSSKAQSASGLNANLKNATSSVADIESFRFRWQAIVNALEAEPGAGVKTEQGAGSGTGLEKGSGAGQGTVIGKRPGTGIEAESADEQADVSGEVGGAVEAHLPQGSKSGAIPAGLQSGISEWRVAAPQVQSGAVAQNSDTSGDTHAGRSVKSDRRDSAAQRLNAEQQGAPSNYGTLATPMDSSTTGTSSSSDSSSDSATISANDLLTLLVTEMQNQDPTADTDPNEYIDQLVQVNSLEQLIDINQTLSTDLGSTSTSSGAGATTQNGYASGQYQSFTIGSDGTVTVTYSNGQQQNGGQLALANVANVQGLSLLGEGDYATTLASGRR
jgi:flagellar hook protein FlgE